MTKDPIDTACEAMAEMPEAHREAVRGLIAEINRLCRDVERLGGKPDKLAKAADGSKDVDEGAFTDE